MTEITIYYDYVCPYVYRAAEWIVRLGQLLDEPPRVNWRCFSLTQVNYRIKDGWKVWEQPAKDERWQEQDYARALRLFWAAEAGRRQGMDAFHRLHIGLLRAIHRDKMELNSLGTVIEAAQRAGLDMARFAQAMQDPSCLERLAADHTAGVEQRVFGVPTFVFPEAQPAYLKLTRVLTDQEALDCWRSFTTVVASQPYVLEIKRPQ
jgi:2-hydroxychromene-2-carboxylate isomerase